MATTIAKLPASNTRLKPLKLLVIAAVLGGLIYLVWKYRFVIKGWFSGGNAETGPTENEVDKIVQQVSAGGNTGNVPQHTVAYWPLKKGAKNDHVRWVQIMMNKVPGSGARISEDGDWGNATEEKVKTAGYYFGLAKTQISQTEYLKMFCKTWPSSASCARFKKEYPDLFKQVMYG